MTPVPFLEFTVGTLTFARPLTLTLSATAEITMRVLNMNKVLRGNDNLELQFQTNSLISSSEAYLVKVQARDLVIYQEQIILNPRAIRNITIAGTSLPLVNGGVLIVALQRLTADLRTYATNPPIVTNSTTNETSLPNAASATVQRWFTDKAQVLIYKAPAEVLRAAVRPNKRVYNPGEQVTFDVVLTSSTGRVIPATEDFQVTVEAVENSQVNNPINNIASSQLQGEILAADLANSNDYTNAILGTGDARILDLVLGTQGWRYGAFVDLAVAERVASRLSTLSAGERDAFQQLFGFTFGAQVPTLTPGALRAPATYTIPQVNARGADFVGNVTNPRGFVKTRAVGFQPTTLRDRTQTLLFVSRAAVKGATYKNSFFLSDLVSSFTITAKVVSASGKYSLTTSEVISTINAYSVQVASAPAFLAVNDQVTLSVEIRSTGPAIALPSRVFVESTDPTALRVVVPIVPVAVAINGIGRVNIQVTALRQVSMASLNILANATAAGLVYEARTVAAFRVVAASTVQSALPT